MKFCGIEQRIRSDRNDLDNQMIEYFNRSRNISKDLNEINYSEEYRAKVQNRIRRSIRNRFLYKIRMLEQNLENVKFPWNLDRPHCYTDIETLDISDYNREYVRLYRWIEEATRYRLVRKLFEKTQSGRGQNSPHTVFNLWKVSKNYSPGKFNYLLARLVYRSAAYIRLFDSEFSPSYRIIGECLSYGNRMNRKTAIKVAVNTIIQYHPIMKNFRDGNPPTTENEKILYLLISDFLQNPSQIFSIPTYTHYRDILVRMIHSKDLSTAFRYYPEIILESI